MSTTPHQTTRAKHHYGGRSPKAMMRLSGSYRNRTSSIPPQPIPMARPHFHPPRVMGTNPWWRSKLVILSLTSHTSHRQTPVSRMGYRASMTLFPGSQIIAFPNQIVPQSPSIWHLKFSYPPTKTDTHPKTRPTLSHAVDRSLITASFVFILAILVYLLLRHPRYSHL